MSKLGVAASKPRHTDVVWLLAFKPPRLARIGGARVTAEQSVVLPAKIAFPEIS